MRWKNRLAGGLLKDCGPRGEWAELYFMMFVAGLGMKVFRPFGQIGRYDVGVENQARLVRVQVKNHKLQDANRRLQLESHEVKGRTLPTRDHRFLYDLGNPARSLVHHSVEQMSCCSLFIKPNRQRRQKHVDYLEAWHLLKETGLTIEACVDPDWPEVQPEIPIL